VFRTGALSDCVASGLGGYRIQRIEREPGDHATPGEWSGAEGAAVLVALTPGAGGHWRAEMGLAQGVEVKVKAVDGIDLGERPSRTRRSTALLRRMAFSASAIRLMTSRGERFCSARLRGCRTKHWTSGQTKPAELFDGEADQVVVLHGCLRDRVMTGRS
jgi:hypothetical protein